MDVPREPYGQFHYLVRWDYDAAAWSYVRDLDGESSILHEWHRIPTGQLVTGLKDPEDLRAIEWHRARSYERDPASETESQARSLPDIDDLLRRR